MSQEHDLILTIKQMDEIVFKAQRIVEKLIDVRRKTLRKPIVRQLEEKYGGKW